MKYIVKKGDGERVIFLLHGTGGDAENLLELGSYLDEKATLVGLEGRVNENGLTRFFARNEDGTFDLTSLSKETIILKEKIDQILKENNLLDNSIVLLGYSNGANILQNLLKEYSLSAQSVLLFHPSSVRPSVPFMKQPQTEVLITYGAQDPYTSKEEFDFLSKKLQDAKINVTSFDHEYGHQLIQEELITAKKVMSGKV